MKFVIVNLLFHGSKTAKSPAPMVIEAGLSTPSCFVSASILGSVFVAKCGIRNTIYDLMSAPAAGSMACGRLLRFNDIYDIVKGVGLLQFIIL